MTDEQDDAGLVRDWAAIVRAVEAVQQAAAVRLETMGMSLPYFEVLTLLLEAEEHRMPMSRIAKDLTMTSGGFTKLADRMARDGLIDRRGSSGDRRVVFAALTDGGLAQAREADKAYREFLRDEVLHAVSAAELRTVAEMALRLGQVRGETDGETTFELSPRPEDEPERRTHDDNEPEPEPETEPDKPDA